VHRPYSRLRTNRGPATLQREATAYSYLMEPLATLDQVRQIDYESRRDRCTGLISPAAKLFAKREEAKAPQIDERDRFAPAIFIGAVLLLYFLLKWESASSVWNVVLMVATVGYLLYLGRHIDKWMRERRIRELDEQLSMMSAIWTGAGASGEHFDGLQKLIHDGDIDFDSDEYGCWFHSFDKFLRIHCGLEYSELNKALHQLKKSA
jgi:hypothetical protein